MGAPFRTPPETPLAITPLYRIQGLKRGPLIGPLLNLRERLDLSDSGSNDSQSVFGFVSAAPEKDSLPVL